MSAGEATFVASGALLGGRYRLERRIAGGGMATVWRAEDTELGRPVAVKVLSDVLATEPGYRERFRREAKTAARLSHPNLVRVFDFGDGERPYLVMEYVPGPTLDHQIQAGAAVGSDRLAHELLGALGHIHRAGVIHRDVKPSNILIAQNGAAKLTDFGIAQPEDATRITETGNVIGTLRYMAPEVARGEAATERSDLYAAGVVLEEVAASDATPELLRFIDHLRAEDPERRPRSAEAALALLDVAPAPTATAGRRRRELEVPLWAALGVLVAIGLAALALALSGGGGGGGSSNAASGGKPAAKAATGVISTTAPTTTAPATTTPLQAAPPPKPPKAEPPKPPKEKPAPAGVPPGLAKKPGDIPPGQLKKAGEGGD